MVKTRKNKKMVGGAGDYYTESTILSDTNTVIKIPEYNDNQKLYLKTYGLLKMPKGLDFADDVKDIVEKAYISLNSDPENKPTFEPHVEFIPSSHGAKYNKVFGDFREYLIKNKDVVAYKLVAADDTFAVNYLKMEPDPTLHVFVFVPPSATAAAPPVSIDDATAALHAFFETITEDSTISLSADEMKVITDPDNYENAIFVIGQVFGIIAPDFNGELLTFDNDELNVLFDPKIFIDLFNKIKPATAAATTP